MADYRFYVRLSPGHRTTVRHGYKKAVVAVAQRLARILFQMWRKSQAFDVSKLNVVGQHGVRARRVYWRMGQPEKQMAKV